MRYILLAVALCVCQNGICAEIPAASQQPAGYMRIATKGDNTLRPTETPSILPPPRPEVVDAAEAETVPAAAPESPATPAAPTETPPDAGMELSAEQAVALALQQNPQVEISDADVEAAKAQVGQAKSRRLPQVGTRAAYTYVEGLEDDLVDAPIIKNLVESSGFQPDPLTLTTQLTVQQTLYAGGQIQAAIRASKFLAESRDWQRQAALQQLAFTTRSAYYDTVLAGALVTVAQESVSTFEKHLSDSQKLFEGEIGTKFEVLRADTELSARLASLETANTAQQLSMLNLRRLLGLPQEQVLHLVSGWDAGPEVPALETLLQTADTQRPELQSLDAGIGAARQQVTMKRGQFKPRAAATGQYQNVDGGGSSMKDGWTFTLGAEWDLYAGGRRKYEVLEAREKARGLEAQREEVQRLVDMDVRQAVLRIGEAAVKIEKEQKTVELAQEALRLANLRFEEGVGIQTEIVDAELALTQAKTQLVQARRDRAVAHASLEKAIGTPTVSGAEAGDGK